VEQGIGTWAGPIGDADSSGDWPSGAQAQDAQPPETQSSEEPIKAAVMDTRAGRSGGYNLKTQWSREIGAHQMLCLCPITNFTR
jgi:hypothetical protein